jgi:hypothetical protein
MTQQGKARGEVLAWLAALAATGLLLAQGPAVLGMNPSDPVNVRDFGASGSKFETTAATTAGSKQVTVAKIGDFKVGQGVIVSRCNVRYTHSSLWGPIYARWTPCWTSATARAPVSRCAGATR